MRGAAEHTAATSRPYGRSTSEQIWKLFSTSLQLACPPGLWPLAHRRRSSLRTSPYMDRSAPLFHQPSAILALRHGFKRGPLPRPADNAFQSCPATLTPAGKHPLTRGQRNLSSGGGFP
jgi:hypothetical protein